MPFLLRTILLNILHTFKYSYMIMFRVPNLFFQPSRSFSWLLFFKTSSLLPFGPLVESHNPLSLLPASSKLPGVLPVQPTSLISRSVWSTRRASQSVISSCSLLTASLDSPNCLVLPVQPTSVRLVHPQSFTAPYLLCHSPQLPLALHTDWSDAWRVQPTSPTLSVREIHPWKSASPRFVRPGSDLTVLHVRHDSRVTINHFVIARRCAA